MVITFSFITVSRVISLSQFNESVVEINILNLIFTIEYEILQLTSMSMLNLTTLVATIDCKNRLVVTDL